MNEKISNFVRNTKGFLSKHSPEILTGIGITGMITSTVLAVKATPKAMVLLDEAKNKKGDKLTPIETVKIAWKPYIPAVVTCVASASCIIGASKINYKRNAALATAYAISERTLLTYRDKVVETIGEKKEKDIRDKVAQDEVNARPLATSQVFITPKGNTMCMDMLSGRYFKSDIDTINKAINELNRQILCQNYMSLTHFYSLIGLDGNGSSDYMGWNIDDGTIEPEFSTCLADNNEPCIVLDFNVPPKYDFDKFA